MARPRKHDGVFYRKEESKFWWMDYRDRDGNRQRESTNTDDWDEAQKPSAREVASPRQQHFAVASQRRTAHICAMVGLLSGSVFQTADSGARRRICPIPACVKAS